MNLKENTNLKGQYGIRIKRDGEYKKIWQENSVGYWLYQLTGVVFKLPFLGKYVDQYWSPNLVTSAGLAEVAGLIISTDSPTAFSYIAVGTDNTAASAGQTALQAEITDSGLSRATGTKSRVTTNVTNDTAQLVKSFSVTGTKAVKEVGVFNAASAGDMLSRSVITTKNVESGDTLEITYKLTGSDA